MAVRSLPHNNPVRPSFLLHTTSTPNPNLLCPQKNVVQNRKNLILNSTLGFFSVPGAQRLSRSRLRRLQKSSKTMQFRQQWLGSYYSQPPNALRHCRFNSFLAPNKSCEISLFWSHLGTRLFVERDSDWMGVEDSWWFFYFTESRYQLFDENDAV